MVSLCIRKFLWILVIFFILAQIVESKKRRAQHSHHHHHRHHRKHPKIHHRLHRPSAKGLSQERNKRSDFIPESLNGTKFSMTLVRFLNETSTPISLIKSKFSVMKNATVINYDKNTLNPNQIINDSTFSSNIEKFDSFNIELTSNYLYTNETSTVDNRKIPSLSAGSATDGNLKIRTSLVNLNQTLNISNEFSFIRTFTNLPRTESTIIFTKAPHIIDKSTGNQSVTNASRLQDPIDNKNITDSPELVKNLQKLFGSTEEEKNFIEIETPVVTLIRKKRALKDNVENPEMKSLLDFNGPAILNDSGETEDWKSSHNVHKRFKRDRPSEFDEEPSIMLSRESNYLQDLEDSFAPSALEIQAQRIHGRISRMSRKVENTSDSLMDKLRIKREAKNEKDEETTVYESVQSSESSSFFKNDSTSEKQSEINNSDITSTIVSTLIPKPAEHNTEVNEQINTNDLSMHPPKSSPDNYFLGNNGSIWKKGLEDSDHPKNISSNVDSFSSMIETTKNSEENEVNAESRTNDSSRRRKSASEMFYLKDGNSISRIGLDDVYPDIIGDPKHPSALVQLVRTKRFGNPFVYPETPDDSYANEADGKTIDEPYAEDNKFIDSVLSKVDYRTMDGQTRYARTGNEISYKKETNVDERPMIVRRGKRESGFLKRMRKKSGQGSRGNRKHRKKQRGKKRKKKKKHRNKPKSVKMKRASENYFRDHFYEINEPEVISPHDGRRRREYEDENEENYRLDTDESSGQIRRDLLESEDNIRGNPVGNYDKDDVSRYVEERDKIFDDTRSRAKRDNALQELKYYENVRETDGGQKNPNGQEKLLLGQRAAGPIRDIKQLAQELLDKDVSLASKIARLITYCEVNELHGYVNESLEGDGRTKNSQASATFSTTKIIRNTDAPPKIVQKTTTSLTSVDISTQSGANAMKRQEFSAKSSTTSNGKPSRSSGSCNKPNGDRSGRKKVRRKRKSHRKWDRWTDWSSCSVTCGRGRQIRWRHCVRNCSTAETEMEEKACQLPACAPGKFLGIFG